MVFNLDICVPALIMLGAAVAALVLVWIFYWRLITRVTREVRRQEATPDPELTPEAGVPVSVIVYARDDAESLSRLLPDILGQSYGAPFEVIVVNEDAAEATTSVVDRLRLQHPNLYLTFTPDGARNLSRKKLALMLGIKAARYPVVVLTMADAVIDSPLWLARMTEPFAAEPDIEVVVGNSLIDPATDTSVMRRGRGFVDGADAVTWLTRAIAGRPYRGIEYNVAYKRDTFFDNRGFSRSLNLHNGDDDIFISEIARRENTAVVLHPDAMVRRHVYNHRRAHRESRQRYAFTGRFVSKASRRMMAFGAWMLWAVVILSVLGALAWLPNMLGTAIAAVIILTVMITTAIVWRRALTAIGGRRMGWTLPWFALMRPWFNVRTSVVSRLRSERNYTWTK